MMVPPLVTLAIGVAVVLGLILIFRLNAFLALISAAIVVSLMAPGAAEEKISRVAASFGGVVGNIGIVIALAAIVGKCLMDSGAADRIVRAFLSLLGERRAAVALMGSGFVLSVPVFFDTVFYLLVPLARSLWIRTRKNYVLYVTAIGGGAAITHTLVPPTPGPLFMANELHVDLGVMILAGIGISLPAALVGLVFCHFVNRRYDLPMRPFGDEPEREPIPDEKLPPLSLSLLPVLLPVVLISANTVAGLFATEDAANLVGKIRAVTSVVGDPNMALLISAVIAMLLTRYQNTGLSQLTRGVETALMSGGVIILITAAGGAFGGMLREAGIQETIKGFFDTGPNGAEQEIAGLAVLVAAFVVAAVFKFAQGSSTTAMITTISIFAAFGLSGDQLGYHPVYVATATGGGSLVGVWMNDSGFWIFSRMSGLTELETIKVWTTLTAVLGTSTFLFTLIAAWLLPLV